MLPRVRNRPVSTALRDGEQTGGAEYMPRKIVVAARAARGEEHTSTRRVRACPCPPVRETIRAFKMRALTYAIAHHVVKLRRFRGRMAAKA